MAIGPSGVFPINTKRLVGARVWAKGAGFRVNGNKRDYLRNSAHEAKRVRGVLHAHGLDVDVRPVIAVSGAKSLTVERPRWDGLSIDVVDVGALVRRLRRADKAITEPQLEEVVRVLGASSSWTRERETAPDLTARDAFARIDRGVGRWNALVRGVAVLLGAAIVVVVVAAPAVVTRLLGG